MKKDFKNPKRRNSGAGNRILSFQAKKVQLFLGQKNANGGRGILTHSKQCKANVAGYLSRFWIIPDDFWMVGKNVIAAWVSTKKAAPLSRQCLSVSHPEGRGSKGRTTDLLGFLGMDHRNSDGTHHRLTLVDLQSRLDPKLVQPPSLKTTYIEAKTVHLISSCISFATSPSCQDIILKLENILSYNDRL